MSQPEDGRRGTARVCSLGLVVAEPAGDADCAEGCRCGAAVLGLDVKVEEGGS